MFEKYSVDELIELNPEFRANTEVFKITPPKDESIINDDGLNSAAWTEAYKTAGSYYDNPNELDRTRIFNSFRYNFNNLINLNTELPNVNSRDSLLTWVCHKHNEYLANKNSENRVNCSIESLRSAYAPDYNKIKRKFGSSLDMKFWVLNKYLILLILLT